MFIAYRNTFLALAALCLPVAAHADLTFFDGTFNSSDWLLSTVFAHGNGGSVSVSQQTSGGDPGAYRWISMTSNAVTPGADYSNIVAFHQSVTSLYDLATQGAITSIDYSSSNIMLQGFGLGQASSIAVEQGGNVYAPASLAAINSSSWQQHTWSNLSQSDFDLVSDVGNYGIENPNVHPDFSSNGQQLAFGFLSATGSSTGVQPAFTIITGIDNWSVTIHNASSVPEASTSVIAGLMMCAGGLLLRRRGRAGNTTERAA